MKANIIRKFLAILIFSLIPFTLAGCGNKSTVQGTLNNLVPWAISEEFVYNVYLEGGENFNKQPKEKDGTYKVTLKKHSPNAEINHIKRKQTDKGSYSFETLEIIQKLDVGTTKITHQSIIRISGGVTLHSPIFASKIIENGTSISYGYINFENKKLKGLVNGHDINIDRKKIMFDNTQLHQLIRSVSNLDKLSFNFIMSAFETNKISTNNITVESKGQKKGKDIFYSDKLKDISAYELLIRKNTKLSSAVQKIYLSDAVKYNKWEIKNPILRFEEYNGKKGTKVIYELEEYKLI